MSTRAAALAALGWLASCAGLERPVQGPASAEPTAAAVPAPRPFVALSANIRYGTAKDGPDAWPLRRDQLVERLAGHDAAIVGLQEALDFQLAFLAERLPRYQRLGQGRDGGTRGEHAALLVDRERFEVVEHGDFWLSPTPEVTASVGWDAALTRICTWAALRDRGDGRTLTVWNVHFDHRGAQARLESARLLAARIAAKPGPHLVLGDLNTGETSPPLAALREAGLRDTYRDRHPDGPAGTFHGFRGGQSGDKIDYVLVDAGLVTVAASIDAAAGPNGRWPSDHHFVAATLRAAEAN